MGRQPTLTVNVNSQQFQQFAQQFNALSGQIRGLNTQFQQINRSINQSNIAMRALQSTMTGVLNISRSIGSEIWKTTKHLVSWSTIIGGVTALLGAGGSLYGIERLANAIMQKRRQALGLGQSYGQTQASGIFNQAVMGSPLAGQQSIALGMHGARSEYEALIKLGIDPTRDKRTPAQIEDFIVKKIPEIMNKGGPGRGLMYAESFGLTKFYDPATLMRLSTKEGQELWQNIQKLNKEYEKQLEISPKTTLAWTEFELQLQAAGAQLQKVFGEALADLAPSLKHLSEGFANFVKTLMQNETVRRLLKDLAGWIEKLATSMKNLKQEQIDNWIKEIRGWLPSMEDFKSALKDFVEVLRAANTVLHWIKGWADYLVPSGTNPMAGAGAATGSGAANRFLRNNLTDAGRKFFGVTGPSDPGSNAVWSNAPGSARGVTGASTGNAAMGVGAFNNFGGFGGGFFGSNPTMKDTPSFFMQSVNPQGQGTMPRSIGGKIKGAINKLSPSDSGVFPDVSTSQGGQKSSMRGPLSSDNWQMSRVANLVVRNVPGSNLFMSAAGMVG